MQANLADRKGVGRLGEGLAAEYLVKNGFMVVARNVRYPAGEIDIVARKGSSLHFIEVKTRSDTGFIGPTEVVTETKKRRMRRAARMYLGDFRNNFKNKDLMSCYFGVIGVSFSGSAPYIECLLDAFE